MSIDLVKEKLTPTSEFVATKVAGVEKKLEEFDKAYEKLATYYCEEPKKMPTDEFFTKIDTIWNAYKKVIDTFDIIRIGMA